MKSDGSLSYVKFYKMNKMINTFDIDGVIFMGTYDGVYPGPGDLIITGRSIEEAKATLEMLHRKGIYNQVFFNPLQFHQKTRQSSGLHKAMVINALFESGYKIAIHYEDDPIQAEVIRKFCTVNVVLLDHNLVEKENVRHV